MYVCPNSACCCLVSRAQGYLLQTIQRERRRAITDIFDGDRRVGWFSKERPHLLYFISFPYNNNNEKKRTIGIGIWDVLPWASTRTTTGRRTRRSYNSFYRLLKRPICPKGWAPVTALISLSLSLNFDIRVPFRIFLFFSFQKKEKPRSKTKSKNK